MVTNHERFEIAFKNMSNKDLETKEIKLILKRRFPEMCEGSMLPNDHASGNKHPCWCAKTERRVFDRIRRGLYKVR